jgi:hypothetical protein
LAHPVWTFASAFALQYKNEWIDLKAKKRLPAMQMKGFARFGDAAQTPVGCRRPLKLLRRTIISAAAV